MPDSGLRWAVSGGRFVVGGLRQIRHGRAGMVRLASPILVPCGMQDFRKLRVWNDAKDYCLAVYRVTHGFPREERFGFTSQMRRASRSIAANLAEGCGYDGGNTPRMFRSANGSASECLSDLIIAHELGFLTPQQFRELEQERLLPVQKQLIRLIQAVERRKR